MAIKQVTFSDDIGTNWNNLKRKLSPDITEEAVQYFLGPNSSFESAIKEHRLFVCDYEALTHAKAAADAPGAQKANISWGPSPYLFAPMISRLQLAAVQLNQSRTPGGTNNYPSMLAADSAKPGNANKWLMAKMFVQAADLNLNQAVNHLGETHLTEEAFAIAMHRQLAVEHPLYILLSFHFAALIVINKLGRAYLA